MVDGGQERDQFPYVYGRPEHHLVQRSLDDAAPRMAARAGIRHLVEQLEDHAAHTIAGEVRRARRHYHRRCQLMRWQVRSAVLGRSGRFVAVRWGQP